MAEGEIAADKETRNEIMEPELDDRAATPDDEFSEAQSVPGIVLAREATVKAAKPEPPVKEEEVDMPPRATSPKLEVKAEGRSQKRVSLMGANLQRSSISPGATTRGSVVSQGMRGSIASNGSFLEGQDRDARSKSIAQRYAKEVREADIKRRQSYKPMEEQINYCPDGLDVARDLISEMTAATNSPRAQTAPKGSSMAFGATLSQPAMTRTKTAGGSAAGAQMSEHQRLFQVGGWDSLFGNQKFQKRMQFLHEHARSGHFVEKWGEDGDGEYDGEFMYGMRHGKGKLTFKGEIYDGEWKWDQRHGMGDLSTEWGDGRVNIHGEWQNGKLNGFGTVKDDKDKVIYEGWFKDGKRHGLGRQVFKSGDMYDGGWQQGRLHDRGVYYFTNGDRLYGMWREGIYDGVGVFHYNDGSISRREYKEGLLMSVQDYDHSTQKFGKTLTRTGMMKHTADRDFPKEVFLLNTS